MTDEKQWRSSSLEHCRVNELCDGEDESCGCFCAACVGQRSNEAMRAVGGRPACDAPEAGDPPVGSRLWRCEQELSKARSQLQQIRSSVTEAPFPNGMYLIDKGHVDAIYEHAPRLDKALPERDVADEAAQQLQVITSGVDNIVKTVGRLGMRNKIIDSAAEAIQRAVPKLDAVLRGKRTDYPLAFRAGWAAAFSAMSGDGVRTVEDALAKEQRSDSASSATPASSLGAAQLRIAELEHALARASCRFVDDARAASSRVCIEDDPCSTHAPLAGVIKQVVKR